MKTKYRIVRKCKRDNLTLKGEKYYVIEYTEIAYFKSILSLKVCYKWTSIKRHLFSCSWVCEWETLKKAQEVKSNLEQPLCKDKIL